MKNKITKASILCLIGLSFYACTEDYFEFDKITTEDWRPDIAVPLVKSSLELEDIILNKDTAGRIQEGDNKILEIVYDGRLVSTTGADVVSIPDQSYSESISVPIPATPIPPTPIPFNRQANFNVNNIELDSLTLKGGDLVVTFTNTYRHRLDIVLNLPSFKDLNGQSINLNFSVPARTTAAPTSRSQIVNLANYDVDLTYGPNNHSTVPFDGSITVFQTSGIGSTPSESIDLDLSVRNINFRNLAGYLGTDTFALDIDTTSLNLFNNFIEGTLFFSNPELEMTILNGYGGPVDLRFKTLKARNTRNANPEISMTLPNNPISLNYPTRFGVDSTKESLIKTNSNIAQVVSSFPRQLIYEADAIFNSAGNSNIRNFITDTSLIALDLFMRLPFEGFANQFSLVDTTDLSFDGVDNLEKGILRVSTVNTFPVEANVQVVFVDSAYNALDSLFGTGPELIFPAGQLTQPSSDIRDFPISKERFEKIAKGDKVIIKAFLDSRNANVNPPDTVRFTNEHQLDITIGLKGTVIIK